MEKGERGHNIASTTTAFINARRRR